MMGGTLYEINLATTKEKEVVSGFETGNYAVSENNQFVAYIADGNSDSGSKITVLNLENSKSFEVAAAAGTYIRPLAFMEDDLSMARRMTVMCIQILPEMYSSR